MIHTVSKRRPRSLKRRLYQLCRNIAVTGIGPVLMFALFLMAMLSLSRVLLMLCFNNEVISNNVAYVLLQGVRVDFAVICALMAIPLLLTILCDFLFKRTFRPVVWLLRFLLVICLLILVATEGATPGFIMEYGLRPNYIFVEYLIYPKEVMKTIMGGHLLSLVLNVIGLVIALYVGWKLTGFLLARRKVPNRIHSIVALLLVLCIVPLGIRSTLGHRPLNPALISFSADPLANTMPLNSAYNVVYEFVHTQANNFDNKLFWDPTVTSNRT